MLGLCNCRLALGGSLSSLQLLVALGGSILVLGLCKLGGNILALGL